MTNSDAPSPKKSENNQDYSFSAASDDDGEFDNVVVNAALNDLKSSSPPEKSLDKRLMVQKRLRIFSTITKKKIIFE
jgi:hypothetical protein